MNAPAAARPLYCSCWEDGRPGRRRHLCPVHGDFQTDIDQANNLIAEWVHIAQSIARQCRWRLKGQCLKDCKGLAICTMDGLTLVDAEGQAVGSGFCAREV